MGQEELHLNRRDSSSFGAFKKLYLSEKWSLVLRTFCHRWRSGRSFCKAWRLWGSKVCCDGRWGDKVLKVSLSYQREGLLEPWMCHYLNISQTNSMLQKRLNFAILIKATYAAIELVSDERFLLGSPALVIWGNASATAFPSFMMIYCPVVILVFLKLALDFANLAWCSAYALEMLLYT